MAANNVQTPAPVRAQIAEMLNNGLPLRAVARQTGVSVATVSRYKRKSAPHVSTPTTPLIKRRMQELTRAFERFEKCPSRDNYDAHQYAIRQYESARGKL